VRIHKDKSPTSTPAADERLPDSTPSCNEEALQTLNASGGFMHVQAARLITRPRIASAVVLVIAAKKPPTQTSGQFFTSGESQA
jgi:hypothetical protein